MGKNLIQQRRGKGNPMYVSLGFRSISDAHHVPLGFDEAAEKIRDGSVVEYSYDAKNSQIVQQKPGD